MQDLSLPSNTAIPGSEISNGPTEALASCVAPTGSTSGPAARLTVISHYESLTLLIIFLKLLAHLTVGTTGVQDSLDKNQLKVACAQKVLDPWTFGALN